MSKSLVEKVKEFDERQGEDLEKLGYQVLSKVDHLHLRTWLGDAGYSVLHSDRLVRGTVREYLLEEKNVYSRFTDRSVELFVERNIKTWENGFSYLTLGTVQDLKQFEKKYTGIVDISIQDFGAILGVGAGGVTAIGGLGYLVFEAVLPGAGLVLLGGGTSAGLIGAMEYKDRRLKENLLKITPTLITNPRQAILQAFHIVQDDGNQTGQKIEKERKAMAATGKGQRSDGIVLEGEDK